MTSLAIINDKMDLTEEEFQKISNLVYEHCGINLHDGKKELVRSRLAKLLRIKGYNTYSDYLQYVFSDDSGLAFSELIDSLSTNLTSFFREPVHFQFLEGEFLPKLFERKAKSGSHRVRAWSAGCSSGEEPYTIAITLLENLAKQAGSWDIKILATDISTRILKRAAEGVYENDRVAPVAPALKNKYLTTTRQDNQQVFCAGPQLKKLITFKYLNLMNPFPFKGPLDFIFCRNVMIYFDKPTQQKLVNKYWNVLDHGGILFTGHSESLTGIEHKFEYVKPTIYRKP